MLIHTDVTPQTRAPATTHPITPSYHPEIPKISVQKQKLFFSFLKAEDMFWQADM